MFKVGEIVVGQNFIFDTAHNGMEAEIIGALALRTGICSITGADEKSLCYDVRWANGEESFQPRFNLRRRKPPTTGEDAIMALLKRAPQREPELA